LQRDDIRGYFRQKRRSDYEQQGRYAVGHGLSPLGNRASLSRCIHRRKVAPRRDVLIIQIIDCRNQPTPLRTLSRLTKKKRSTPQACSSHFLSLISTAAQDCAKQSDRKARWMECCNAP
jgi:hypothetical protein